MKGQGSMRKTFVEIDLKQLGKNVKEVIKSYPDYKYVIGVLKSDAYGHGVEVVKTMKDNGVNYVVVSYFQEALKVRKLDEDIPILCMQPIELQNVEEASLKHITLTVHDLNYLKDLMQVSLNRKLKIHLKIDSGMSRLGFQDKESVVTAKKLISESPYLELEGIYTHFATVGFFDKHWDDQLASFQEITSLIDLGEIPIVHLASSTIMLAHPKISFANGVRLGILLYGYNVSPYFSKDGVKNKLRVVRNDFYQKKYRISDTYTNISLAIAPAFRMYTYILQIKTIAKGSFVGYGATYEAKKEMKIAILPIGYANGIASKYVLIHGKRYNVIGEISMNMMTIEVDDAVSLDDEVVVLGDEITLGLMSRWKNTGLAESLLDIGNSNERVYVEEKRM